MEIVMRKTIVRASVALQSTIPPDVLAEIKAAPTQGDVIPVTQASYPFSGQILKAQTLTFESGGRLILEQLGAPWLAIVAKTIKFAAPEERAAIVLPTSSVFNAPAPSHPSLGQAGQGDHGGAAKAGGQGHTGANGASGYPGTHGQPVPTLYILADEILTQPGNVPPDFVDLYIEVRGIDGSSGGIGQSGQTGGVGGSGGPSDWNGFYCEAGAGDGGRGGTAGAGGNGGSGGNGSNGGTVFYGGSSAAVNLFEYSKVNNLQGRGGSGGLSGSNGNPGSGGPRGEHRGDCEGGVQGASGSSSPAAPQPGAPGTDGQRGLVFKGSVAVGGLF